jgi:hypothetical protein
MTDLPTLFFFVAKINGQLIFEDHYPQGGRNPSTIWCIIEADKIYNWPDFKHFAVNTGDYELNDYDYSYSKQNSYNKLVPDFNFHAWPGAGINDYNEFIKDIDAAGKQPYEQNKVGWIGSISHPNREILLDIGNNNKELFDFKRWGNWHYATLSNPDPNSKYVSTPYISTPDLVKMYAFLIDVEGEGYSGRVKHLLWSHRPLLLQDRPHKEYFYEFMKEWEHFIPVKRDLSDLVEKTQWCLNNYSEALKIAENAYQFAKIYLTREACYAQWNKIITEHIQS